MAGLADIHTTAMHDNFAYLYATWTPDAPLELGDYGIMQGRGFQKLGNIKDSFQIRLEPTEIHSGAEYTFKSANAVQVTSSLGGAVKPAVAGATPVAINASVTISFSRENAVFFLASDCTIQSLQNLPDVDKVIMGLVENKQWNGDQVVLTSLYQSSTCIRCCRRISCLEAATTPDHSSPLG